MGVIVAVALPAHAGDESVILQHPLVGVASILAASIRVVDNPYRWPSTAYGLFERVEG